MSTLNREIPKILKRIDKIAKGGREKYLDFYSLVDEMVKKSKWDIFKQALYHGYYIEIENFSVNDSKPYTWKEILKSTNRTLDEQKFKLFKSKGVWTQALNYYLESNSFKLGSIKEVIFYPEDDYRFYSQQVFDRYQVTTQNKFLDYSRIKLEVSVNHVFPFFLPTLSNGVWEEANINWDIFNINWDESPSLTQSYTSLPLYGDSSGFFLIGETKQRIESGLRLLGLNPVDIKRIIRRPSTSLNYILVENKYKSFLNQKIRIDFNLKITPFGGSGQIHLCVYDYLKKSPKFIPFVVDGDPYSNYEYSDGEEIIISGNVSLDLKSGDFIGLGLYNKTQQPIDSISFTITNCSVSFISQEIMNTPQFLTKADIDWIRLNNSCKLNLIGEVSTLLPGLSDENITFSDWDEDISREKNIINLYTQAIDYLIDNYEKLTPQ